MNRIVWSEKYDVGVGILNEQHKKVIGITNSLVDISEREEAKKEDVSILMERLGEYAVEHFLTEEALMRKHGYPGCGPQESQHAEFKRDVISLSKEVALCGDKVPEGLMKKIIVFILDWWMHHILESDIMYKSFFREKGVE